MVAAAGETPWPQITSISPALRSNRRIGTSPPGPFRCGSTTCSAKPVATPASKALPPFSRMAMPVALASQWVEVTTPKVPRISGRVVNMRCGLPLQSEAIFIAVGPAHVKARRPQGCPEEITEERRKPEKGGAKEIGRCQRGIGTARGGFGSWPLGEGVSLRPNCRRRRGLVGAYKLNIMLNHVENKRLAGQFCDKPRNFADRGRSHFRERHSGIPLGVALRTTVSAINPFSRRAAHRQPDAHADRAARPRQWYPPLPTGNRHACPPNHWRSPAR